MIYYSVEFFCLTYYLCFFNDTVTTEIYTLSLHDSLRICVGIAFEEAHAARGDAQDLIALGELEGADQGLDVEGVGDRGERSEEHTSELQSQSNLVCSLLLEKKKQKKNNTSNRKCIRDLEQ